MIRFEVDQVEATAEGLCVPGRVLDGVIRIGSVFSEIDEYICVTKGVSLVVLQMFTYGREVDALHSAAVGRNQR